MAAGHPTRRAGTAAEGSAGATPGEVEPDPSRKSSSRNGPQALPGLEAGRTQGPACEDVDGETQSMAITTDLPNRAAYQRLVTMPVDLSDEQAVEAIVG